MPHSQEELAENILQNNLRIQVRTQLLEEIVRDLTSTQEMLRDQNRELQRHIEVQTLLRDISGTVVLFRSMEELYLKVHCLVERMLPATNFSIYLLDETPDRMETAFCTSGTGVSMHRPLDSYMAGYVMRQGRTVHVTSAEFDRLREAGEVGGDHVEFGEWMGAPLKDSQGNNFGIVALTLCLVEKKFHQGDIDVLSTIATQISMAVERKRLDEALAAERTLLVTLINTIPDRIFVKDKECRFTINNIAHLKALGANSQAEVIGKTDHDFRLADLADRYFADDQKVIKYGKPLYDYEEPTRLPSGETGTLLISKAPLHSSTGEVIGLIGISRDITKRKQAEELLRRNAEIQTVLREIAEAAVVSASLDELYEKVHQSVERILSAKNFFVALLDPEAGEILVPYCVDETGSIPRCRPVGKGLAEYVMRQGTAAHLTADDFERLWNAGEIDLRFIQINEWLGAPLRNSAGEIFGVIAMFTLESEPPYKADDLESISIIAAQVSMTIERKKAEGERNSSQARYRALVDQSFEGLALIDIETQEVKEVNKRFTELLGYSLPEDAPLYAWHYVLDSKEELGKRYLVYKERGVLPPEARIYRHKNGTDVFVERAGTVIDIDGRDYLLVSNRDMTVAIQRQKELAESLEQIEAQKEILQKANDLLVESQRALAHQATHDSMTNLLNRRAAVELLSKELARCKRNGDRVAIGICDIDHFKMVNDTWGHQAGDEVLCRFAEILSSGVREYDTVARIGGEEFLVIAPVTGGKETDAVFERLCALIAESRMKIQSGELAITVSIGVAYSSAESDMDKLLMEADNALYQAKAQGRNRVVYSSKS